MDDKDILIVLCKKCYDENKYFIPVYQKGKNEYEIELKCPKNHIIEKDNIIEVFFDDKLKKILGKCQIHNEVFCGWYESEFRHLCFLDVGKLMTEKKDYLLYANLMPSYATQIKQKEHIKKINELLIKYKNDTPELNKEIEYLAILKKHIDINLSLFYDKKIHNYQIVKNIDNILSIITPEEIDDLDKKRLLTKYNGLLFGINKQAQDMGIKDVNFIEIKNNFFGELIGKNPKNNKKNYFMQFIRETTYNAIYFFDSDGHYCNTINLKELFLNKQDFLSLMFSERVLIIYYRKCLNFYILSDDYKNYETYSLYFQHLIPLNTYLYEINYNNDDLLKINSTNILFINNNNGYVITFDDELRQVLQLFKLNSQKIIKASSVYYMNENQIIETGIIIISENTLNDDKLVNLTYKKNSKFTMYNDKLEIINAFDFTFDYIKNPIIKIHYTYKNHMALIFTENNIFILKIDTQEIITIYDISSYINTEEKNYLSLANKIKIIYSYDKAKNKIEEKIIIINDKINQACLYNWEDKILVLKDINIYHNLYNILAFYPSDILYLLNVEPVFEPEILLINATKEIIEKKANADLDLFE